jgi:hypothetical protein
MQQQRRRLEGRLKQIKSFEERLAVDGKRLRDEAKLLSLGSVRNEVIRKASQAETGPHVSAWLRSPGLQQPK